MFKTFLSYFWPALCGLLVAAIVWLAAPNFLVPESNTASTTGTAATESLPADLSGPISYSAAVRRAAPSVVNIYTSTTVTVYPQIRTIDPTLRSYLSQLGQLRPATQEQKSLGTGVIVSREGYVLTNEHVIAGADQILVALNDGRTSKAQVVGVDSATDLAVLKIEMSDLTAVSIGDPDASDVGDVVLAIGNAQGFQQTVTQGILSAKGRSLADMGTYVNVNFLQTDAAINHGNSGGPLVDVRGDMIGINSRTLQSDGSFGLSFAIPADLVLEVFRDIVDHGKVIRGWLGFQAGPFVFTNEAASALGRDQAFVVTELYPGGPAHRAGLEIGDLIIKINGEEYTNIRAASRIITNAAPGDKIDFEVIRDQQTIIITVLVGSPPEVAINTN